MKTASGEILTLWETLEDMRKRADNAWDCGHEKEGESIDTAVMNLDAENERRIRNAKMLLEAIYDHRDSGYQNASDTFLNNVDALKTCEFWELAATTARDLKECEI